MLLRGSGSATSLATLTDHVRVPEHGVVDLSQRVAIGDFTRGRVSLKWAPEKKDEGLRLMNLVVDPATRLLHTHTSPLIFVQETTSGHVAVDRLGQKYVSVLVFVILVLFRVLDLVREMRHYSNA